MTQADQIQAARTKLRWAIDRLVGACLEADESDESREADRLFQRLDMAIERAITNYTSTVRRVKK